VKFYAFLIFVLLVASSAFSESAWKSFSHPFPVRSAIAYYEGVLLATDGGIRYRTQDVDYIHHSENGLETSSYYALATSKLGTFAVSEAGIIAMMNADSKSWHVLSRSYVSNSSKVVPDGMVTSDSVLVIAFNDHLSFFDVPGERSIISINKISDKSLTAHSIEKLAIHKDSLFALVDGSAYVRVVDWKNVRKDVQLSNPFSWKPFDIEKVEEFSKDRLKILLQGNAALLGLNTKRNDIAPLYDSNGESLVKWCLKGKTGYYLVTDEAVIHFDGKSFRDISENENVENFLLKDTYEIGALSMGGVIAVSTDGATSHGDGNTWSEPKFMMNGIGSGSTGYSSRLKTFSTNVAGDVFLHIWGLAYYQFTEWTINLVYDQMLDEPSCIDNYLEDPTKPDQIYRVSVASTPAPDGSGFLSTSGSAKGYSVLYFTNDGEVYCSDARGSTTLGGPMVARIDENGSWVIYVGARKGVISASEGDLDVFTFPAPKSNGGELNGGELKTYHGLSSTLVDMVYDTTENRVWGVSISDIGYFGADDTAMVKPTSTRGLQTPEFTSIDMDVRGNLWVGTENQGAYRLSRTGKSPDTLVAENFNSRLGMMANDVSDLAVDPVLGAVWFSHSRGVSRYYRNDLKNTRKNMTDSATADVKAYPIPFRPRIHHIFNIDNIAEDALVSIFNRGGALIRSFRNEEILGGKVEWNGTDDTGNLVAPGVYYYVVKNSSKVKKGKFIIIH